MAHVPLGLPVTVFALSGVPARGLDEPIARRWGPRIAARGRHRDAVRSSKDDSVEVRGPRPAPP